MLSVFAGQTDSPAIARRAARACGPRLETLKSFVQTFRGFRQLVLPGGFPFHAWRGSTLGTAGLRGSVHQSRGFI